MRLLLDEQISPRVARALRELSHDVVTVLEEELAGAPDETLWSWAIGEQRVIVTYNIRDFTPLASQFFTDETEHADLVLISSRTIVPEDFGALIQALDRLIATERDLTNCCYTW